MIRGVLNDPREGVERPKKELNPFEQRSIGPLLDAIDVRAAYISFLKEGHETFRTLEGIDEGTLQEQEMLIPYYLKGEDHLQIEDLSRDRRFKNNPLLKEENGFRSLLAVPIKEEDGRLFGTFCVLDTKTRKYGDRDIQILQQQARITSTHLEIEPLKGISKTSSRTPDQKALAIEEGARRRKGKSLHDDVVQPLAAGKMFLEALKNEEASENEEDPSSYIDELRKILQNSLEQARKISQDLQFLPETYRLEELVQKDIETYEGGKGRFDIKFRNEVGDIDVSPHGKRRVHHLLQCLLDAFSRNCPRGNVRFDLRIRPGSFFISAKTDEEDPSKDAISSLADPLSCIEFLGGHYSVSGPSEKGMTLDVELPLLDRE